MNEYLPIDFEWTLEDKKTLQTWTNKNVYLDLGDSVITGGEVHGKILNVDIDDNLILIDTIAGEEGYAIDRVLHVELHGTPT